MWVIRVHDDAAVEAAPLRSEAMFLYLMDGIDWVQKCFPAFCYATIWPVRNNPAHLYGLGLAASVTRRVDTLAAAPPTRDDFIAAIERADGANEYMSKWKRARHVIAERAPELPKQPQDFMGTLRVYHLDDQSGLPTMQASNSFEDVALRYDAENSSAREYHFVGRHFGFAHPSTAVPLTNHANGLQFVVFSHNHGVIQEPLFVRGLTAELCATAFGAWKRDPTTVVEVAGGALAADAQPMKLRLEGRQYRHAWHVDTARLVVAAAEYDKWLKLL